MASYLHFSDKFLSTNLTYGSILNRMHYESVEVAVDYSSSLLSSAVYVVSSTTVMSDDRQDRGNYGIIA